MPKICADCKFYKAPEKFETHQCHHPKLVKIHPVTGEVEPRYPTIERAFGGPIQSWLYGWCGEPGRLWEPKDA